MTLREPQEAVDALVERLGPVTTERVALDRAVGRVLAEPVKADRDSPPRDVSSMDGYAVRLEDLRRPRLPLAGEIPIGSAPPAMVPGHAWRIVTGACVPAEAEAVVRREDTEESDDWIRLTIDPGQVPAAQFIRRQGENLRAGAELVAAGTAITPGVISALASFGTTNPLVYRRVIVGLLTTGDELVPPSEEPPPWKIRDANGPTLSSLFGSIPWLRLMPTDNAGDSLEALEASLRRLLGSCDAVLATGGVSMGNRDFVPAAVERVGGQTVFHKLRQRPGKPMLGAVGGAGQAVLGLPGNPVSVMVTARRYAYAVLRRLGGFSTTHPPTTVVALRDPDDERLDLWWHRPVRLTSDGEADLLPSRGSGDIAAAARSDGFVCLPPGQAGRGPWPYWSWRLPE